MHKVSTLKDKDILKRKRKLYIPESIYDQLMRAIESDSKFLSQFEYVFFCLHVATALAEFSLFFILLTG